MNTENTPPAGHDKVLSAHGLVIGYRHAAHTKCVHANLSFDLYAGELTCLLGANGTGKSTLLRTLAAAQPALRGDILLMGRPLASYSAHERSRTIGVVLTDKTGAGGLTVYELVALGRQPHTGFFGRLNARDRELIDRAMTDVGIDHKQHSYTAELSDGERQKALIAKALVQECPLILLDEPTAFLDVTSRIDILGLLRRLAVEQHKAILLSTHDVEQALLLSDRLWLLTHGAGMHCGATRQLLLDGTLDPLFSRTDLHMEHDADSITLYRKRFL